MGLKNVLGFGTRLVAGITMLGSSYLTAQESAKPNIIYIMSDDHTRQAIGCYGSKINSTPNIDRIANEGVRFTNCFVTNSICAPSRAAMLTGKYSHLNGVTDNYKTFDGSQVTFPKILQKNNYQTAIVGKWHLKSDPTGFDFWKVLPGQGQYYNPDFKTEKGTERVRGHSTDLIGDFALDYLENKRDTSKPFMMMVHFKAPHRSWWPSPDHVNDFADTEIPEPETLFDDYENRGSAAKQQDMSIDKSTFPYSDLKLDPKIFTHIKSPFHLDSTWYESSYNRMTDEQKAAWDAAYKPRNKKLLDSELTDKEFISWKYQRYIKDYLRCVNSVDKNIGRLLEYLDEKGLAENTIIIYTSDQGFYLGEHGWFDKRFMYEESFSTPFVMRWPAGVKPGSANSELVMNIDFAPTLLTAAGVDVPKDMQGKALQPILNEISTDEWRDAVYYHYSEYPHGWHAVKRHIGVRTKRYKLIHFYYDVDEWELYDLQNDPQEMKNEYDNPAYAEIIKKLILRLSELQAEYGETDDVLQAQLKADLDFHNK